MTGVERVFDAKVFDGDVWGLEWFNSDISPKGVFPQYFKHVGDQRVAVAAADVPAETQLLTQEFKRDGPRREQRHQPREALPPDALRQSLLCRPQERKWASGRFMRDPLRGRLRSW